MIPGLVGTLVVGYFDGVEDGALVGLLVVGCEVGCDVGWFVGCVYKEGSKELEANPKLAGEDGNATVGSITKFYRGDE